MSWGYKIAGLYSGFVIMMIVLVTMSMKQQVDLVTPDYYKQELSFQEKIDKVNRTEKENKIVNWQISTGESTIAFPAEDQAITGTIYFYRPSDAKSDKRFEIKIDENAKQKIITTDFLPGIYKLEIDWKQNDAEYFTESMIKI